MEVVYFNKKIEKELFSFRMPVLARVYRLINLLQIFGNRLIMPYSKQIGPNLFELRVRGQQEIRIFYGFVRRQAVIAHYCVKKSQKIPKKEYDLAHNRLRSLT